MKVAYTVFVLLGLFVSVSRADFIAKFIGETSGQTFEFTAKLTKEKQRLDALGFSLIQSSAYNEPIFILHASRVYFKFNLREIFKTVGSQTGAFKPTGKTEIIEGYATQEYEGDWAGMQMTIFLTDDPLAEKKYDKFAMSMRDWINGHAADGLGFLTMSEKVSGFPVRFVTKYLATNVTFTFESIEEAKFDDSEFVIPSDYTEAPLLESLLPGLFGQ